MFFFPLSFPFFSNSAFQINKYIKKKKTSQKHNMKVSIFITENKLWEKNSPNHSRVSDREESLPMEAEPREKQCIYMYLCFI